MGTHAKFPESKRLTTEDLLELVTAKELPEFAKLLHCTLHGNDSRQELADFVKDASRVRVVCAIMSLNGVWIAMMRDVVAFLERSGASLRTTGCIVMLQTETGNLKFQLSPQIADIVARFDNARFSANSAGSWDDVLSRLKAIEGWISMVRQNDNTHVSRRLTSRGIVRAASGGVLQPVRRVTIDPKSCERMFSLWRTLDFLVAKLGPPDQLAGAADPFSKLRNVLKGHASFFGRHVRDLRRDEDAWQAVRSSVRDVAPWSEKSAPAELLHPTCWKEDAHWDRWLALIEDTLSLANLETSSQADDLLRLELLKDRPRLYEVWCVARILSWYRAWGCTIWLESLRPGKIPVWQLNYARASKPVARIELNDRKWWFFYQLFRGGADRANMPDVALLDGPTAGSNVVWVADPKYSEAEGYTLKDYVKTAERYRDAFDPRKVWICEFHPRRQWFDGATSTAGDRFSILTEVQPGGQGTALLRREIRSLHNFDRREFVLAVDCSASFQTTLAIIQKSVQLLAEASVATVCFSRAAHTLPLGGVIDPQAFLDKRGTLLEPLVRAMERLSTEILPTSTDLVLVSDMQFSDNSNALMEALKKPFAQVQTANSESSLVEILAARCRAGAV